MVRMYKLEVRGVARCVICNKNTLRRTIWSEVVSIVVEKTNQFVLCIREHSEPMSDYLSQFCANPLHISKNSSTFAALTLL